MVKFNELRITSDGTKLIIDASVINSEYFENVYIKNIVIDSQDTYTANGPSSKPVYKEDIEGNVKNIYRALEAADGVLAPIGSTLFYVYIITNQDVAPNTPCGEDVPIVLGVVGNFYSYFQYMMRYIKEVVKDCCDIPKGFIDAILRLKAIKLCIKTGNYTEANTLWNKYFKDTTPIKSIRNCGCYGRSN